jgi:hypothetical protein
MNIKKPAQRGAQLYARQKEKMCKMQRISITSKEKAQTALPVQIPTDEPADPPR